MSLDPYDHMIHKCLFFLLNIVINLILHEVSVQIGFKMKKSFAIVVKFGFVFSRWRHQPCRADQIGARSLRYKLLLLTCPTWSLYTLPSISFANQNKKSKKIEKVEKILPMRISAWYGLGICDWRILLPSWHIDKSQDLGKITRTRLLINKTIQPRG